MPAEIKIVLPPESMSWGRWMQQELMGLKRSVSRAEQDSLNTNKTQTATMATLSKQIAAILQTQTDLAAAQATLSSQQTTLSNQQTTLDTTVTNLSETQTDLANRSTLVAAVSAGLTLTSSGSDSTLIKWDGTASPSVTFNLPMSSMLITFGAKVTANSVVINNSMYGYIGYSLDGTAPSADREVWDNLWAQSPYGGPESTKYLTTTRLLSVTPNVAHTIAARYGYLQEVGGSGMTAAFSERYVSIIPIP